jgi:hypothetical protein
MEVHAAWLGLCALVEAAGVFCDQPHCAYLLTLIDTANHAMFIRVAYSWKTQSNPRLFLQFCCCVTLLV